MTDHEREPATWRNRIVGHRLARVGDLLAHPDNWRIHPSYQQEALSGVMHELGMTAAVRENRLTGHLIDGHLRVMLTLREFGEDALIPVDELELTEDEERASLATFDPISALAGTDAAKLSLLLNDLPALDPRVEDLFEDLRNRARGMLGEGTTSDAPTDATEQTIPEGFEVIVTCENEFHQAELLDYLNSEGYVCRALVR